MSLSQNRANTCKTIVAYRGRKTEKGIYGTRAGPAELVVSFDIDADPPSRKHAVVRCGHPKHSSDCALAGEKCSTKLANDSVNSDCHGTEAGADILKRLESYNLDYNVFFTVRHIFGHFSVEISQL